MNRVKMNAQATQSSLPGLDGEREALYPLTMVFPPGAFVPLFRQYQHLWENGDLMVTFRDRGQLEEDVFVSCLARQLGLVGVVVSRGDMPRVEMREAGFQPSRE